MLKSSRPRTSVSTAPPKSAAGKWQLDARSATAIAGLEPVTAALVTELVRRLAGEGLKFVVTSGTRTFAEQAALYAQGRTAKGDIVTRARPGYSWHNFGVAADLTQFNGTKPVWDGPGYDRMGKLAAEIGLEWGGSWKTFKDRPHVQRRLGITLAEARKRYPKGIVS